MEYSTNWFCVMIAINLMITICFGLNPFRLREALLHITCGKLNIWTGLERWYYGVTLILGLVGPMIPIFMGHYGFDESFQQW